jgi:hypothetical protein
MREKEPLATTGCNRRSQGRLMRPGGLEFSEPQMITPRRAWLIAARGSAHMIQRARRRLGSPRRGCLGEVELPQRSAILIFRCRTIAPAPPSAPVQRRLQSPPTKSKFLQNSLMPPAQRPTDSRSIPPSPATEIKNNTLISIGNTPDKRQFA